MNLVPFMYLAILVFLRLEFLSSLVTTFFHLLALIDFQSMNCRTGGGMRSNVYLNCP